MNKYGKGGVVQIPTVFGPFAMFFLKRPLKRHFTDIYLLAFFGDGYLGYTSAMRVILFLKMFKFNVDFKNAEKSSENVFRF